MDGINPFKDIWQNQFDSQLIKDNIEKIFMASKILTDKESLKTFWGRLLYRLTYNPLYSYLQPGKDYFHPACCPSLGDTIIDGGAFTGDTVKDFLTSLSEKCIIHAFEPDLKNFKQLKKLASKFVHTYNLGLYSEKKELEFISTGKVGSHILNSMSADSVKGVKPNSSIQVIDLDTFCIEQAVIPSFIKLDVEGAEIDVLEGGAKTLQKYKPKLAISAYHNYDDLWDIPLKIKEINPDYTLYLAHFGKNPFWDPIYYAS